MGIKIPGAEGEELALRLRKSLYGLVSAGRLFNKFVVAWALRCGFRQLHTDECMFTFSKTEINSDESTTVLSTITCFVTLMGVEITNFNRQINTA